MIISWLRLPDRSFTLQKSRDLRLWRDEGSLPEVARGGLTLSHTLRGAASGQGFFRLRERTADTSEISETPSPNGAPQVITTIDGGQSRRYLLYLPPGYSPPAPASRRCDNGFPLAIICHGSGQTASEFAMLHPALITKCGVENVILVLPQGTWNTESMKYSFNSLDTPQRGDDVAMVVRIADQLQRSLWVDRDRIYIGGFSNGGNFTQRAVARSPGTFAAFTAIGSSLGGQGGSGNPNASIIRVPVPIDLSSAPALIVSGRKDDARPFEGGPSDGAGGPLQTPAIEMPLFWHSVLRCAEAFPTTTTTIFEGATPIGQIESACTGTQQEVTFVDLKKMDHIWPDAIDNVGWDANAEVIDFFLSHERGSVEDLATPDPITAPAIWTRTIFQGRDAIYHIPTVPAAMIFVAHDSGGDAGFVEQIEMVEILEDLAAEGIGFFAVSSDAAAWDTSDTNVTTNPDLVRVSQLHAELVATTDITTETHIVTLGYGFGGHFALLAGEHLDGPTLTVGGIALLATPLQQPLPPAVEDVLASTSQQIYFANGENDSVAPPLPAWEHYRRITVYPPPELQQQRDNSDFCPGKRKRIAAARATRVPGITAATAADVIDELVNANIIDIDGHPLVCPDEIDCANLPLPAGLTAVQAVQLRRQLCAALAGHAVDSACSPSLRLFAIGARNFQQVVQVQPPTSAPADPTPIATIPKVMWTRRLPLGDIQVRAYIPPAPDALVFFFHGTRGGIGFYDNLAPEEMIHALYAANIGVLCSESVDRDNLKSPGSRWNGRSLHPETDAVFFENPDWVRLMALRDEMIATTGVTVITPVFSMGFSNGGGFALTFAHLAQQAGLDFRGAAVHAQPAFSEGHFRASRRIAPGTPFFLSALVNDGTAGKMPILGEMLTGLGQDVTMMFGEEVRLKRDRFQRIRDVSASQSEDFFRRLVADGIIDSDGLRLVDVDTNVNTPSNEHERQLKATIYASHVFSTRFVVEEVQWFVDQLP
ncbi:MAG: poly(3-hydroxybutyrate) depolymerase [Verrucomicrobiales bacterium]